jgi:hypothetical protein
VLMVPAVQRWEHIPCQRAEWWVEGTCGGGTCGGGYLPDMYGQPTCSYGCYESKP